MSASSIGMADIINLSRARKGKQRAADRAVAAENRARHGRTKAEKAREAAESAAADRTLDGARRDLPSSE